jgi:hypothetical protein
MKTIPARKMAAATLLLLASIEFCSAVETRVWEQSEQADFARGTRKGLSIRSDGRLSLAPAFKELDSTGVPYLWALAEDSKKTIYYAGGAPTGASTKVFALPHGGKPKVYAELQGLEVHALAVDREDRVYAATLPDAKVYRIDAAGKAQVFFDPKCKYIWAMTFDTAGNLFVATGENGLIYKVNPDGTGKQFFDTQEAHARSLAIDKAGNLIVGTEPGGMILRVTPAAQGFVLYQAPKREVTSVAVRDGVIYAAAIGNKGAGLSVSGPTPVLPATPKTPVTATGTPRVGTQPPSPAPATGSLTVSVTGGSEFYRIQQDGFAEKIWASPTDLIYAIGFDEDGKPLLGTGNKGTIYRVDSDYLATDLINAPPTQVTNFLQGHDGIVYAVTGNVGNLYSIGPSLDSKGTLESEVLDASLFSHWGKAHLTSELHGGQIELETRSGNVNNPQDNWSSWSKVPVSELGGEIQSPPARFLQFRLTLLRGAENTKSPQLSLIDIPFLPKNIPPRVEQIEAAPFNYRQPATNNALERSVAPSGSPLTLTLSAVGRKRSAPSNLTLDSSGSATLQYAKGYETIRWNATDGNGDPLSFKVEIRQTNSDDRWQLLKSDLLDKFYAFDSASFPDGKYVVRVTASDAPGNTPQTALTSALESDPFVIDNSAPEISNVSNGQGRLNFRAKDALSWIDKAQYSVNGGEWILLQPEKLVTDSQSLNYSIPGKANDTIAIRVFDENDNSVVRQFTLK